MKHYFIETWGCQMNDHDSEKFAGTLKGLGYRPTQDAAEADLYLLNTCSVREKAQEKVFSRLGVLKGYKQARGGQMVIGVTGCVAQQEGEEIFRRAPYVDLVLGTQALKSLPELLAGLQEQRGRQVDISRHENNHLFPTQEIERQSSLKALITIMEGCDNYCTYCIVPFTRGRERSRPLQDILHEAKDLAQNGFVEIELLGQNVNSYRSEVNFAGLLEALAEIPGLQVIRFVSPHPKDFSEEVVRVISRHGNLATNLHLPAQSGNSWILKRMGREYSREQYLDRVAMIRGILPEVSLTSDFIVGFPGESEAMFEDTLSLLQLVGYDRIFSFAYSSRPGTGALKHGDPVPMVDKNERLRRLQALQEEIQAERMKQLVGRPAWLLVDQVRDGTRYPLAGRTRSNLLVHVLDQVGDPSRFMGRKVDIEITDCGHHTLRGRLASKEPGIPFAV